jgi:hypothetical protein
MLTPPPETNDIRELKKWCDDLYMWLIFPDKFECNFIELSERSADFDAPGSDRVKIYAKDSGGGKTKLVARFATGAVQDIATEP